MSTVETKAGRDTSEGELADERQEVPPVQPSPYFRYKGIFDRCLAFVLLLPAIPLLGLLIVLVRGTSRGPGIFRQVRVGAGGRRFTMYKIRTMTADAEAGVGAVWSKPGDPRHTPVGRILRKLHLDELPQLFNVLRGEMSLIGPRPERPEFVVVLAQHIPGYLDRLLVPPGITGLAQINLPPDTDLDSVHRKQMLDLEYIRTADWWMDARMLLSTLVRMIGIPGTVVPRWLGLERRVHLPPSVPPTAPAVSPTPHGIEDQALLANQASCELITGAANEHVHHGPHGRDDDEDSLDDGEHAPFASKRSERKAEVSANGNSRPGSRLNRPR